MEQLGVLALVAAFLFFISRRLPRYLHIFQQEEYDSSRFYPWLLRHGAFDRKFSLTLIVISLGSAHLNASPLTYKILLFLAFLLLGALEEDPRKKAKKKLVMTQRAARIYDIAFFVSAVLGYFAFRTGSWLVLVLFVQLLPLSLGFANLVLKPLEARIQSRIMAEAKARLREVDPHIIGITGSFGKTSVKHILGHVLELNAPTLYTPGSVNTLMGISRVIREGLHDDCRFFLSEMGAYRKGSIARLCDLTPPTFGIITSIGAAHYERFKTLDAVVEAKFELAEAVLLGGAGAIAVHDSLLELPSARAKIEAHPDRYILCGESEAAAARLTEIRQEADGLHLTLLWKGQSYALFAPLFGRQQAGNIALAFALAVTLGLDPERVQAALRTVPQITHRLEVKPQADGSTLIDDAYNANPVGFRAALEVLSLIGKEKGGRRILITPGMAELGAKHNEAHKAAGNAAADLTDLVIVVRGDRIPSFCQAYLAAGRSEETLLSFATLTGALDWVHGHAQKNDVILLENDLPDLYESGLSL